ERLKARRFAVRDAVVHECECDFGNSCALRETSGQVEADNRPFAAERTAFREAHPAFAAWELCSCCNAVAWLHSCHAGTDFEHLRAEFVPNWLNWRFFLEPALAAIIRECRNALRKLCFRDAWLHADRFDNDVTRSAHGFRDLIEPQVAECVKPPGFHVGLPDE